MIHQSPQKIHTSSRRAQAQRDKLRGGLGGASTAGAGSSEAAMWSALQAFTSAYAGALRRAIEQQQRADSQCMHDNVPVHDRAPSGNSEPASSSRPETTPPSTTPRLQRQESAREDPCDIVLIQSYELLMLPSYLHPERVLLHLALNDKDVPHVLSPADSLSDAPSAVAVGLFWQLPFPTSEVFKILPQRVPLLQGMLAADLVGECLA